jgi:predicted amidohydrolase YtcJ
MRTLFSGGPIHTLTDEGADWLLIDGDKIVATGPRDDMPAAESHVDLEGATLVPGFCDAHAHLPATGLNAAGMDFRDEHSVDVIAATFAERAKDPAAILYGANFEDPLDRPFTRHDLDRAVGSRPALLARADLHSCVVSTALLNQIDIEGLEGVDRDDAGAPSGFLREKAAGRAWMWFDSNLPRPQLVQAIRSAVNLAYSRGITRVQEMYVVEWRGWGPLEVLREAVEDVALDVSPYIATDDVQRVTQMGFKRIGGDYFLDGSFGSCTAWLQEDYAVPPPHGSPARGVRYHEDAEVLRFFEEAQGAGLQVGVHAIGDAAIDQALRSWEAVAEKRGLKAVRSLRHRIEHFECASDDHIRRAARLGIAASVQPAFDLYWGGEAGMYATRIGWERASQMNRFRSMLDAGLVLGGGSDSTVTPLDPFLQMKALRDHHVPGQRLSAAEALEAHTLGGHSLTGSESYRGTLAEGMLADLAMLDRDPLGIDPDELTKTEVLGAWCLGTRVWPQAEAHSG